MAVPKKRTSKSKKNIRKSHWKKKVSLKAIQAFASAQKNLQQFKKEANETKIENEK